MASLTTSAWLSLYKDKSLEDQVKQLQDIMKYLGIAQISLKDDSENNLNTISLNETSHFVGTHPSFSSYIPLEIIFKAQKIINRIVINSTMQGGIQEKDSLVIFKDEYTEFGTTNRPFVLEELINLSMNSITILVGQSEELYFYDILTKEDSYKRFIDDWKMEVAMVLCEREIRHGALFNGPEFERRGPTEGELMEQMVLLTERLANTINRINNDQ